MVFGHFHLDSHNFMVTVVGSCVKSPLLFFKVLKTLQNRRDLVHHRKRTKAARIMVIIGNQV